MINAADTDRQELRPASLIACLGKAVLLARTLMAIVVMATSIGGSAATHAEEAASRAACTEDDIGGVRKDRRDILSRGVNISGWLDEDTARIPDMGLLRTLRNHGFRHVRLPIEGMHLMPAFAPEHERTRRLEDITLAVNVLLDLGYGVVVDMHPGSRFRDLHVRAPNQAFSELQSAWRTLATALKDAPLDGVFFELLNEPAPAQSVWEPQARRLIAALRKIAPHHTIVYGTADLQQIGALTATEPLAETNIVYAVHFYDPMVFTHQGMDWDENSPYRNMRDVPYPASLEDRDVQDLLAALDRAGDTQAANRLREIIANPWDDTRIAAIFGQLADWASRHGRPLVIGEFGVLKRAAPPADRARWLRAIRIAAEHHCIGWSHWELDRGFGLADESGRAPDPDVMEALLSK